MKFWKIFVASLLAIVCGTFITIFILFSLGAGALASLGTTQSVTPQNSVLMINFAENISDSPLRYPMSSVDVTSLTYTGNITLREALTAIESASLDPAIKGICIRLDGLGVVGATSLEELRCAVTKFKESGKFVVAYDDNYSQGEYYLASVADEIMLQPEGSLEWRGTNVTTLFYKGLIDKIDAKVEIFRPTVCRYKSAVEPYFLKKMSPENRRQMEAIVNSTWQTLCEDVALSRGLGVEELKEYAAANKIVLSEDAVKYGLVDRLAYEDELYELLRNYGVESDRCGHVNSVTLGDYITFNNFSTITVTTEDNLALEFTNKPLMAIIYAEGEIVDGDIYMDGQIHGTTLARELRQARLDERTKAVVVRVNSPGGSALASDVVWREMKLLQETKPVVISMGDMAASGGYYISAPADAIVANRLTLTGSIGVFGMMLNLENTLSKRLGIDVDVAASSDAAVMNGIFSPLSKEQREAIMRGVDRVYESFTEKVSEGRNLTIDEVYAIAEGRVWSGSDAKRIGLADYNGGFTEAISVAANLADLGQDFQIYEFLSPLTPFEEWISGMGLVMARSLGLDYDIYGDEIENLILSTKDIINMHGVQARLAGDVRLDL